MQLVDRRIGLLFALFLLALTVAAVRATWLGTVRSDDLRKRAATQHVEDMTVNAPRGTIFDGHGTELAVSEDAETVFANPLLVKNPARTATQLAPLLGVPVSDVLEKLADKNKGFVYLKRKLDP